MISKPAVWDTYSHCNRINRINYQVLLKFITFGHQYPKYNEGVI